MYETNDFKASDMLWKAYCMKTTWDDMPVDFQLRTLRDCLTLYRRFLI